MPAVDEERNQDYWAQAAQAIAGLSVESIERICISIASHWTKAGRDPEELRAVLTQALDREALQSVKV